MGMYPGTKCGKPGKKKKEIAEWLYQEPNSGKQQKILNKRIRKYTKFHSA